MADDHSVNFGSLLRAAKLHYAYYGQALYYPQPRLLDSATPNYLVSVAQPALSL